MDSAKWQNVKNLMSAALNLSENERAAFLAKETDKEILAEVEKLLLANEKAADFIEKPILLEQGLAEVETKDSFSGKNIENYLILERIGTGGMGTVYLAERTNSDFKQKVALKIIKRGMDSEAILQRFANERRILSTLKHPNIAQLLDGGISSQGLPFFVMEYIEGKQLTEFCLENNLSLAEQLKIFLQVCEAVEYAHKNLIIHRDLKPSNIIVTNDGVPKLLDFGIAKLLSDDEIETTATQNKIFTPEYASPEQVLGKQVTTATDVYSLGIILYELLSGHRPYETKGKSFEEIVKSVCETEPVRPSSVVSRALQIDKNQTSLNKGQKTNPKFRIQNLKSLKGDLDNIILKALRKEPAERYGSVQQFSEDIMRFLQGFPVLARPNILKYRFGKYVKRHKVGVLAAAMVLVSLIGGTSVAIWQAIEARRERAKAEKRFNDVRQLANTILFDHYERIKRLPGATEARAKLISDALVYLDKIAQESFDNPDLQRELVVAYRKLADVQGGVIESGNLGEEGKSRENLLKALAIQENIVSRNNSTIEDQRLLGNLYLDISSLFRNENERKYQVEYIEKGLNIFQNLKNLNPNQVQREADLASALWSWANIVRLKGSNDGAIKVYSQAAEIYENLAKGNQNSQQYKRNAALTYKNIGTIYFLENNAEKALEYFQKAFIYDKENADLLPDDVRSQLDLSFTRKSLATTFRKIKEHEKALEEYKLAIEIQEKIFTNDSKNKFAEKSLFTSYSDIAKFYYDFDNLSLAAEYYQKSEKMLEPNENRSFFDQITVAIHFFNYANLFLKKAETAKNRSEKLKYLLSAREKLTDSVNIFQAFQKNNTLDPAYSEKPAQVTELLEKTNREISKLS